MKKKTELPAYPAGSLLRTVQEGIVTDPFGSYTGIVKELDDTPVQDADDL